MALHLPKITIIMKKTFTLCCIALASTNSFSQAGQILNGGFENWTTTTVFETPNQWKNSNSNEFKGIPLCIKSTDATDLVYSVRLENEVINGTDSLFGYVYQGDIIGSTFKGIPYSSTFDGISGFYKGDMQGSDSAYILVVKSFMGTSYPPILKGIGGTAAAWTPFSIPVTAGPCDSVFVALTSSSPFDKLNFNPGSFIQFDNIYFTNSAGAPPAAIPNNSFENWTAITETEADYFSSFNFFTAPVGPSGLSQTTDKYTGTYAAQLETYFYPMWGDTIPGFLTTGALDISNPGNFMPTPYVAEPATFSGFYKYAGVGADFGQVSIQFYQAGSVVAGFNQILPGAATYTPMGGSIGSFSGTPDSMIIYFFAGNTPGSILKVDDISFSGGTVGMQEMMKSLGINVYPNPVTNYLNLEWNGSLNETIRFVVFDISGNEVYSSALNSNSGKNKYAYDFSFLPAGAYSFTLSGNNTKQNGKLIKH